MAYLNESHIEIADINYFVEELGYTFINASEKELLGRRSLKEVVLNDRLINCLRQLNENIPEASIV